MNRLIVRVSGDATLNNAKHPPHYGMTGGEQEAKRMWDAQHPRAFRLLGEELLLPALRE